MKRLLLLATLLAAAGCAEYRSESFRPRGLYNNAVHRFFPDVDRRQNAIRYGRWRALEVSWRSGISENLDADFSERLLEEMRKLPDFPPDARLTAPRFAREAPAAFDAVLAADTLERQVADILAAGDATPARNLERIERALNDYQKKPAALSAPATEAPKGPLAKLSTARLLLWGDWLFARADEDLVTSDYGEQRWKVKATVDRYDEELAGGETPLRTTWYEEFAPTFSKNFAAVARALDLSTRFRVDVFSALAESDLLRRREAVRAVERRYGLAP